MRRDAITLRNYLESEWLPMLEVGKLRPKTLEGYKSHVVVHLAPTKLGAIRLQDSARAHRQALRNAQG